MSQPSNIQERVAALEAAVTQLRQVGQELAAAQGTLRDAFTTTVPRLTAMEEALAAGQPRLAALEEAAQGFDTRVRDLEGELAGTDSAVAALNDRLSAAETILAEVRSTLGTLGQVARPGRTVMRKRVDEIQETLAEILTRLPETPPNGGTAR